MPSCPVGNNTIDTLREIIMVFGECEFWVELEMGENHSMQNSNLQS